MRDGRLFSQRMSGCTVPTRRPSLLPASMLQTLFGHHQTSRGHRIQWTLIRTLSQADRQAAHRASAPGTRMDKVGNQIHSFVGQTAGANHGVFTDLSGIVLTATCPQVPPFHLGWEFARMLFLNSYS